MRANPDLSVDARLIRIDLQEHVADAQRHALRMRDDDFDLLQLARARKFREPAMSAVVCVMGAGEERRTVDLYAPSAPALLYGLRGCCALCRLIAVSPR